MDPRDRPPNLIIDDSPPSREWLSIAADRAVPPVGLGLDAGSWVRDIDSGNNIA
jgi:hypothetical protein